MLFLPFKPENDLKTKSQIKYVKKCVERVYNYTYKKAFSKWILYIYWKKQINDNFDNELELTIFVILDM